MRRPWQRHRREYDMSIEWKRRARLFVQRFWQPTSACMTCMPGSWGNVMSLAHWTIAFHTGLLTGLLAVLLTFTAAAKLFANRYGNALLVGILTMIGDVYSHAGHYYFEHIVTGVISGFLALVASYLFENRAYRLRAAWTRVFG
jgi:ABC-type thiamin/hydroxymethylpyrimidine transport system permease subunit